MKGSSMVSKARWRRSSMVRQLPPCVELAGHRVVPKGRAEAIKEIGLDPWTSRWKSFARRLGVDRQGMHAGIEFSPQ